MPCAPDMGPTSVPSALRLPITVLGLQREFHGGAPPPPPGCAGPSGPLAPALTGRSEEEYREQYDRLYDQFEDLEAKRDKLSRKLSIAQSDAAKLDEAIRVLETTDEIPMDFDPMLWRIIVEKVLVGTDGTVTFIMVGGTEYRFNAY